MKPKRKIPLLETWEEMRVILEANWNGRIYEVTASFVQFRLENSGCVL